MSENFAKHSLSFELGQQSIFAFLRILCARPAISDQREHDIIYAVISRFFPRPNMLGPLFNRCNKYAAHNVSWPTDGLVPNHKPTCEFMMRPIKQPILQRNTFLGSVCIFLQLWVFPKCVKYIEYSNIYIDCRFYYQTHTRNNADRVELLSPARAHIRPNPNPFV